MESTDGRDDIGLDGSVMGGEEAEDCAEGVLG